MEKKFFYKIDYRAWEALSLWVLFIILSIIFNRIIPFILGIDQQAWTYSTIKFILFSLIIYAVLFLAIPLILTKGWKTVRQPDFLLPLLVAMIAIIFWLPIKGIVLISLLILAYLHWRFDLSDLGIRSRGLKGDFIAIFLIGILSFIPVLLRSDSHSLMLGNALLAGIDRLFANPGSSIENLFYFGFLTERLSNKAGIWLTPPIIGLMYMVHEMTNPEYWYENVNFFFIFVSIMILTVIYLWRRNTVTIWLGDGLSRLITRLF